MNKAQKKEVVESLKDKIKTNNFVLSGFKGLTVSEIEELKKKLRTLNYSSKVVKNRLLSIALKELSIEGFDEFLIENTVLTIQNEKTTFDGFKVLSNFSRDNDKFFMKAGFVEGRVLDATQIKKIADLPTKEVLISKLLAQMNAPISKFVYALNNPILKLVYVLDSIKNKKETN